MFKSIVVAMILKKFAKVKFIANLLTPGGISRYLHVTAPVQLHDFVLMGGIFFEDPKSMIASLGKVQNSPALSQGDFYPMFFNSNPGTLALIRELIKHIRPKCVVETGVANGFSTRQILESFKEFELFDSRLFSFDVDPKVFSVELERNPQFNKVVIDSASSFLSAMHKIGSVDLFYHDSDHSYENQLLEYDAAWRLLSHDGVLISDDVNWSNAFLDFCKKVNRTPLLLSDGAKFAGVIFRDGP